MDRKVCSKRMNFEDYTFDIEIGQFTYSFDSLVLKEEISGEIFQKIKQSMKGKKHGFCNLELKLHDAIKVIKFLRKKSINCIGIPIQYKRKNEHIKEENALEIAKNEIIKIYGKYPQNIISCNDSLIYYDFRYEIEGSPNFNSENFTYLISIDKLDGHVWNDKEFYDFTELWR
jgi:hypothetical protein